MAESPLASTMSAGSSSARDHHHFDHGYAVTIHSAQGLTAERVLIHADTDVHPELVNSISRASREATVFTNDAAKLGQQLRMEVGKSSAIELAQTPSISQDLTMSIH